FDHWGDRTLTKLKEYDPPIDLFILDLMLPGRKTGYDILAEIRKDSKFDGIPAVIVSGADPDMEIPRAQEKGVSGFICKPIDRYRFPHQLLEIMNGGEVWDQ
ncbi:MAG: response regulator, partial [Sphaerospermopsis sp. SIO1G2]|nr:response regulator [Sphaerospermopsis sp. SIO1G2]